MKIIRRISYVYHEGGDYFNDHVGIPETLDTLSVIIQNGNSISSLFCFNVLDFAFGNVLGQKFIHELQRSRDLLLGPWYIFREELCADIYYCSPVQHEHRDFRSQGGYVCNTESCRGLSIPNSTKTWVRRTHLSGTEYTNGANTVSN